MNAEKEKKKPCDNKPNHDNLPIDIELFNRIFHETYSRILTEFAEEKAIAEKVSLKVLDVMNEILDNHVERATRKQLKE